MERKTDEYMRLLIEGQASLNEIRRQSPNLELTVNKMIDMGGVVGQMTLPIDESGSDVILFSHNYVRTTESL